MKVAQIVAKYLSYIASRADRGDLSLQVQENYARDLADFAERFGTKPVSECRQHDISEFLLHHPSWKSVNTKRSRIASVLACFNWARDEELIPVCPYTSPRSLRGLIAETRRPASHEEFAQLMEVASRPLKWGLLFLYRTGCRTCEMRELTWDCVRLDGEFPHLFLAKHKTVRRTGRARIVGLDPLAVRLLRAIRRISKSDYVFTNCHGYPWRKDAWCHHLRRTCLRFGLDDGVVDRLSAYCLRHTYACDGIEAGLTEDQIAHQLGNSPEIVRRVYSRKVGQKISFISGVAAIIGKNRGKV